MGNDSETEIRNSEGLFGTIENADGSPVQEVVKDGEVVAEIRNEEGLFATVENADGTPVKEVVSKS